MGDTHSHSVHNRSASLCMTTTQTHSMVPTCLAAEARLCSTRTTTQPARQRPSAPLNNIDAPSLNLPGGSADDLSGNYGNTAGPADAMAGQSLCAGRPETHAALEPRYRLSLFVTDHTRKLCQLQPTIGPCVGTGQKANVGVSRPRRIL